ncbi:DUF6456 domain-containing protein [Pseudochrobactrum sp. HB0163]|uniref:DUF6456 domain-containing protein n=1 Tax=Pseudochrobactrum sp. HB0163 TaxID=3450708 RepID=UPI003F6DE017
MKDDVQSIFSLTEQRLILRLLRFLVRSAARLENMAQNGSCLLINNDGACLASELKILHKLNQNGAIACDSEMVELTVRGRQLLSSLKKLHPASKTLSGTEAGSANGQIVGAGQPDRKIAVNIAESPLAVLYRLKGKNGRRFLTDEEFQAGERLRADFTHGNMMPRISANWEAGVAGRVRGERGGAAEMSDHALDCRERVHKALEAVGPELSGLLLDICCFLKGLEQVERERLWPARSAKMLLKTALGILHRHYSAGFGGKGKGRPVIYHWGDRDYRPSL